MRYSRARGGTSAHDINNAISPASLYVEAILTHESGFSDRARKQLEIVQRAVDDVAQTVKRMGEFYRLTPSAHELAPVEVERILREVRGVSGRAEGGTAVSDRDHRPREVPPEVHSVLSKPPRVAELRQKLAEITGTAPNE